MIDKVTFFVRKHEYASHHFPSTCVLREYDKRVCSENKGMRGIFNDRQKEMFGQLQLLESLFCVVPSIKNNCVCQR